MEAKSKLKLRKFIEELKPIRGRHTELVTVYIPTGYDIHKIINHLQQEQDTASNIKDKTNRKRVQDSLERMIRHLRIYKKTPENGLAAFSGNASGSDTKVDIKVWSIEPPEPINTRLYRCDQYFVLDILEDMVEYKETYGLIVIDRREGNIGLLKGNTVNGVASFSSDVPGKTTKGGQSQQRYARIREAAAKDFFKKIGDAANKEFLEMKDLKGIIIGGPGPTKEDFLNGDYLNNEVKKKVLGTLDLSYTGEFGLNELVDKSQELLAEEEVMEEKKVMQEFFTTLATNPQKTAYGKEVDKAFEYGAVKIVLLSDSLDSKDIEEYEKKAEDTGAEIKIISTKTREGEQLKEIGKVAAILRFVVS